jgi:EAL and modified HD-GYP domain-containing signal transduction protein
MARSGRQAAHAAAARAATGVVDPGSLVYIGRQPILDIAGRLVGYELLQRTAPGEAWAEDDEILTMTVTAKALVEFGLDRLVGTAAAYVNTPAGFLIDDMYRVFPPEQTVLEVLERVTVDDDLVAALKRARSAGYRLALDDYQGDPAFEPLLDHVDIVKVDIAGLSADARRRVFRYLQGRAPHARVVAEKVEDTTDVALTQSLGAHLFQGFFFAKPTVLTTAKTPSHATILFQLTQALEDPDMDMRHVSSLVAHEPRLSYQLLRLVNSASIGLTREVDSVERASTLLGADHLRRLVLLLIVALRSNGPDELVTMAVLRAKLCESLAKHYGAEPAPAFTTGMLSMIDVAFQRPMEELLAELPLRPEIRDALVHRTGALGALLTDVVAYERAEPLSRDDLVVAFVDAYFEAAELANELTRSVAGARG